MKNFEDAVIAETAYRHGADMIISRNVRDYENSPVRAVTPKKFIELFKPDDLDYEMVDF